MKWAGSISKIKLWLLRLRLSKVLGSQEKRAKRIWDTLSELRTQLTPQFAKSLGRVSGYAGKQAKAAQGQQGFTIVELTIATLIFSIILVVAMASFVGINRVYYKGRTLTETNSVSQQIATQVSADMQFAPSVVTNYHLGCTTDCTGIPTDNTTSQFVCFGNVRYTYKLSQEVAGQDVNNEILQDKFGLIRDAMPGTEPCASPFGTNSIPFRSPVELLSPKMRLSSFDITPSKNSSGTNVTDLWDMNVTVAYGDDEVLNNPLGANVTCDNNLKTTQFCSVSKQVTSVSRGF